MVIQHVDTVNVFISGDAAAVSRLELPDGGVGDPDRPGYYPGRSITLGASPPPAALAPIYSPALDKANTYR